MRTACGAQRVFGLDVVDQHLAFGSALAEQHGCSKSTCFGKTVPVELEGQFDLVLSSSAFEHYREPDRELQKMRTYVKRGGWIIVTSLNHGTPTRASFRWLYAFPGTNIPVPWLNLMFSDQALLAVRSKFQRDHPARIEDVEGGLNRMSVAKFEKTIRSCGMESSEHKLFATMGLPIGYCDSRLTRANDLGG